MHIQDSKPSILFTTRDCFIELTGAMMYFSFSLGLWIHPIFFSIGNIKYFTIFSTILKWYVFHWCYGWFHVSDVVNNSTFLIDQSQLLGLKMNKNNGRTKLL